MNQKNSNRHSTNTYPSSVTWIQWYRKEKFEWVGIYDVAEMSKQIHTRRKKSYQTNNERIIWATR